MDFKNALKYLQQRVSYENLEQIYHDPKNLNLQRVRDALKILKIEYSSLKFVHVAGSKGKGTTAALLALYLKRSGFKVGLYTSPHLFDIKERVTISGKKISAKAFAFYVTLLKEFVEKFGIELTYFEILTILAIKFFVDQKVDFAVLEVGIGGRLDATNVVDPVVTVLTRIEREHLGLLGGNLESIVNEKLGIVKEGVPFVVGYQSVEVDSLIKKQLAEKSFQDCLFVRDFEKTFVAGFRDFVEIDFALLENAKLAYLVLKTLFGDFDEKLFFDILKNWRLSGHFEVKKVAGKTVVFDVAHTVESVKNLLRNLRRIFPGKRCRFLIALMRDKDKKGILKLISGEAAGVIFTHVHELRGELPMNLAEIIKNFNFKNVLEINEPMLAYRVSLDGLKENEILVVTGSHFLVGRVAREMFPNLKN